VIPHPALRATFSRREKDNSPADPSPSGRGWPEGPDEGSAGPGFPYFRLVIRLYSRSVNDPCSGENCDAAA